MHKDSYIRTQHINHLLNQYKNILDDMQQQGLISEIWSSVKLVKLTFQILDPKKEIILAEMQHQGLIHQDSTQVLLACETIQGIIEYLKYLEVSHA